MCLHKRASYFGHERVRVGLGEGGSGPESSRAPTRPDAQGRARTRTDAHGRAPTRPDGRQISNISEAKDVRDFWCFCGVKCSEAHFYRTGANKFRERERHFVLSKIRSERGFGQSPGRTMTRRKSIAFWRCKIYKIVESCNS